LKDLILGLDPGSRHTGYGVIAADGDHLTYVSHGVIDLKESWSLAERLRVLHLELNSVFAKHSAKTAVIEKIFFGKNADSAFKLGHARGVCLLAAAINGAVVEEYAARFVKKCITGSGAADKEQVQMMIFAHLRVQPMKLAFDATDALSLAVTHARMRGTNQRLKSMLEDSL
jgi:crossover junction endodeoxyribonuclease RuvC